MSFFESQFPPNYLLQGFTWKPTFHTTTVVFGSGSQQRNKDWSAPLGSGAAVLSCDETAKTAIQAFFLAVGGGFDGFRAKIWADYIGTNQLIGVSDGSTTVFQLVKQYITGARTFTKNIYKPVAGTVTLVEGTTLGGAVNFPSFTVDSTTGLTTLTAQPTTGHSIWATFQFDTPVTMIDELDISVTSANPGTIRYSVNFSFQEIREIT